MTADAGLIQRQTLRDISAAIRTKGGASGPLLPSEMAQAILSIAGGGASNPEFLSHSDSTKILVNAFYNDYDSVTPAWGGLTITGAPTVASDGVRVAIGQGFTYDLGEANHEVTVYAIVAVQSSTNSLMAMSVASSEADGKAPNISEYGGRWRKSNWSDTVLQNTNCYRASALALSLDLSNGVINFYADGVAQGTKSLTESGRTVRFNGSVDHTARFAGDLSYLFIGIVDGCEDSTTILANQADMMQFLQNGRIACFGP